MSNMKPILFNTEMVKAILGGRKTTTRMIVKVNNSLDFLGIYTDENGNKYADFGVKNKENLLLSVTKQRVRFPYNVEYILYVRETWNQFDGKYYYRADEGDYDFTDLGEKITFKWKPSIHMPKEAERIFLKVTNVKVERLQDITEEGARHEGASNKQKYYFPFRSNHDDECKKCLCKEHSEYGDYRTTFAQIWDNTLNKNNKLSWMYTFENNPYVWVIEFERISKEKAYAK